MHGVEGNFYITSRNKCEPQVPKHVLSHECVVQHHCHNSSALISWLFTSSLDVAYIAVRVFNYTDSAGHNITNPRSINDWVPFQNQTAWLPWIWVVGDMSSYLDLIAMKPHFPVYPSDKAYCHTNTFQIGSAGIHTWRSDVITSVSWLNIAAMSLDIQAMLISTHPFTSCRLKPNIHGLLQRHIRRSIL